MNPSLQPASVNLRGAERRDTAALTALSLELGYAADDVTTSARLDALLDLPDNLVLVAEVDGDEVAGWVHVFVACRLESDAFAELGGLVVGRAHRRLGIGRALVEAAEQWARSRMLGSIRVRTNVVREDACAFYGELHFESIKTQSVLSKRLDEP